MLVQGRGEGEEAPSTSLPHFAQRLADFLKKLDREAPLHRPHDDDEDEGKPGQGKLTSLTMGQEIRLNHGPAIHTRNQAGVLLSKTNVPDDAGFGFLKIQVPRPDTLPSTRARPRWASLTQSDEGLPKEDERYRGKADRGPLQGRSGAFSQMEGGVSSAYSPQSSIPFDVEDGNVAADLEEFIVASGSPNMMTHWVNGGRERATSLPTLERGSQEALSHGTAPAGLSSSSCVESRSSRPETGQSNSITSPSDGPTHPAVQDTTRSTAVVLLPMPALPTSTTSHTATSPTLFQTDGLRLRPPFEQEADLTEGSFSLERSSDERRGSKASAAPLLGKISTSRSAGQAKRGRSRSSTEVTRARPATRRSARAPNARPTRTEAGLHSPPQQPVTPLPVPILAARALDFAQMTAITTPEDSGSASVPHDLQKDGAIDTPRSPSETRGYAPAVRDVLKLLPGGNGSVQDQLRTATEASAVVVKSGVGGIGKGNELSHIFGPAPVTETLGGAAKGKDLSQTQSNSATDEEEEGESEMCSRPDGLRGLSKTERMAGHGSEDVACPIAVRQRRPAAQDLVLLEALDRERGQNLKRRADIATGRIDRLQGQEKRMRSMAAKTRTLGRSRSVQERSKRAIGSAVSTTGQGKLELSDAPPQTTHALHAAPNVQRPPTSSAPIRVRSPSPPRSAASSARGDQQPQKRSKPVPQKKPNWTSLEACVASWNTWIAEGRLPTAHPLVTVDRPETTSPAAGRLLAVSPSPTAGAGPPLLFAGMVFLIAHTRYHAALASCIERLVRRGGRALVASPELLKRYAARELPGREEREDTPRVTHLLSLGLPRSASTEDCMKLLELPRSPSSASASTSKSSAATLQKELTRLLRPTPPSSQDPGAQPVRLVTGEWLAECLRQGRVLPEGERAEWTLH